MRLVFLIIGLLFISPAALSAQSLADSVGEHEPMPKKENIITKAIKYFENSNKDVITNRPKFSFIGGPHYSSDTKFGIGLLAAGLYSTDPEIDTLKPSNVTLFADVTTGKYFKIGIEGLHLYSFDTRRVEYEVFFNSYSTYYWGSGVNNGLCDDNKTRYLLLNVSLKVNHLWKFFKDIYIGPMLRFDHTATDNIRNVDRWGNQPHRASIVEFGATVQFDSRDSYTYPTSGLLGNIALSYSHGISSAYDQGFSSLVVNICHFAHVWNGGVLASRLRGVCTFGDTPWCYMPTLGAAGTMRGYYEGQYRDKREVDLTFELRQHLYRRSGIVAWGGVGALFPSIADLRGRHIMPSYGVGYRWEFKKNTNVRIDVGFGKKCWGVEFNIGEAF